MTIFPNSASDVESLIISYCDTNSLISLTGLNKNAYQLLPNDGFFNVLFNKQHPKLQPYDRLFSELKSCHPANCYKVMCTWMSSPRWIIWNPSFLNDAIPHIFSNLKSKKLMLENEIKSICGSYFADPNSLIDKAWQSYKKCQEEKKALEAEISQFNEKQKRILDPIIEPLKSVHSEAEIQNICFMLYYGGEHFLTVSDEALVNMNDEERGGFLIDYLPVYREIAKVYSEPHFKNSIAEKFDALQIKYNEKKELKKEYRNLEAARIAKAKEIILIDESLTYPTNSLLVQHAIILSTQHQHALKLEKCIEKASPLNKCLECIQKMIDDPKEKTPEGLDLIRQLINSSSDGSIWRGLYHRYANGVIEDSWSEKHFQDFLPELKSEVEYELFQYTAHIEFMKSQQ